MSLLCEITMSYHIFYARLKSHLGGRWSFTGEIVGFFTFHTKMHFLCHEENIVVIIIHAFHEESLTMVHKENIV